MAAAVKTILNRNAVSEVGGTFRWCVLAYTFSSSYATGGESITAANFGFPQEATILYVNAIAASGQTFRYDLTNKKLIAVVATTGVEVANAVDLSAVSTRVFAIAE